MQLFGVTNWPRIWIMDAKDSNRFHNLYTHTQWFALAFENLACTILDVFVMWVFALPSRPVPIRMTLFMPAWPTYFLCFECSVSWLCRDHSHDIVVGIKNQQQQKQLWRTRERKKKESHNSCLHARFYSAAEKKAVGRFGELQQSKSSHILWTSWK